LRNQLMSPSTPSIPYPFDSFSKMTPTGSGQAKYQQWARDRWDHVSPQFLLLSFTTFFDLCGSETVSNCYL